MPNVKPHETVTFDSQLIQLVDGRGKVVYTVWTRSMKETGETVFYGVYSTCQLPSGACGVKAVFPLPQGNVTVIFALRAGPNGELQLVSSGMEDGDTGFYVFVEDRRGNLWKHYLPSVRQQITVCDSKACELGAEHLMEFWMFKAYHMSYTIRKMDRQAEKDEG